MGLLVWLLVFGLRLNAFQRGDQLPVFFAPSGFAVSTRMNVTGWNGSRSVVLFDVTNSGHGGNTARLGGKRDGSGEITLDHDADNPHYLTPYFIVEGTSGIILEFITPTKAIQTPIIIEEIPWTSAVGSQLKVAIKWKMNSLAGLYVLPAS